MTKILSILLVGVASGISVWWFRRLQSTTVTEPAGRGEVIYRSSPLVGSGE